MTVEDIPDVEEKEIVGANILHVAVGTNGRKGGDAGHGSRTHLAISNRGGTSMEVSVTGGGSGLAVELAGDSELETFTEALDFASKVLRKKAAFDGELPIAVLAQIEVVERDLALLGRSSWGMAESKRGSDRLREAANRVVLSAKHLESMVRSSTFPAV
jgi:hypothetical protein